MAKGRVNESKPNGKMPEGYANAQAERSPYWYKPETGSSVEGFLVGRFARAKGKGYYYQIRVVKPCEAAQSIDGKAVAATLDVGDIINMDERKALECLRGSVDSPTMVYIKANGQRDLDNGQTFWDFTIGKRPATQAEVDAAKAPF